MTAAGAAAVIPARAWQRMPTGTGTKGIRDYDWAMIGVTGDDTPDGQDAGHGALLVRQAPLHQGPVLLPVLDPAARHAEAAHRLP